MLCLLNKLIVKFKYNCYHMKMRKNTLGKAGIVLSMMIFGSIGLFVRSIDAQSSQIALARAVIGSAFLLILIIVRSRLKYARKSVAFRLSDHGRNKLIRLIISGIAIGFNWIFLFQAYRYTSIAVATVSYYFAPVFIIVFSPLVLKEKLSRNRLIAVIVALIGLAMTIAGELTISSSVLDKVTSFSGLIGIGYGLAAALLYASVILITKSVGDFPGLEMTQIQLVSGMVILLPYVALTTGFDQLIDLQLQDLILLLILGILHTGFAYFIYFSSAKKVEAQSIAILSYIDPLFAIFFAALFLREFPGPLQLAGGLLILGAAYFGETANERSKKCSNIIESSST